MHVVVLFLFALAVSLVGRRVEEWLDAQDELLRRAGGQRRAFQLMDWDPRSP